MSQLRLVSVTLISLTFLMSACAKGDSSSSGPTGVAIDTNGDGVTDGYDTNGDGVIDSTSSSSSTGTRNRSNFQSNNTNTGNSNTNNSGNSNTNTTTTIVHNFEVNHPLPFSAGDFTALQSEAGFINPHSSPIFVVGTIQQFRVKGCKTSDVQVKWTAGSQWITYAHFFSESSATPGSWGEGTRHPVSLLLPAGGALRVRDDTNPNCAPGTLSAASVRNEGVLYVGEPGSFDWNRSIIN